MVGLKRTAHFVSPFTLEKVISRLRERDEPKRSSLSTFLSKSKGVRFVVTDVDASGANFLQFKHGLSIYTSIDRLRLGGVAIEGTMKRREDGKTDVVASSTFNLGQCILSSASLLIAFVLLSTLLPWVFLAFGWHPLVVLLIDVLLWLGSAYVWAALLRKIVDDLFNVLKWTLHGLSVRD